DRSVHGPGGARRRVRDGTVDAAAPPGGAGGDPDGVPADLPGGRRAAGRTGARVRRVRPSAQPSTPCGQPRRPGRRRRCGAVRPEHGSAAPLFGSGAPAGVPLGPGEPTPNHDPHSPRAPVVGPSPSPRGESLTNSVINRSRRVNTDTGEKGADAAYAPFAGTAHGSTPGAPAHPPPRATGAPCTRTVPRAPVHRAYSDHLVGQPVVRRDSPAAGRRGLGSPRTAVQFAPDALAGALRAPAPAVGEAVHQGEPSPAGRRAVHTARHRRPAAAVGHLQADDGLLGRL